MNIDRRQVLKSAVLLPFFPSVADASPAIIPWEDMECTGIGYATPDEPVIVKIGGETFSLRWEYEGPKSYGLWQEWITKRNGVPMLQLEHTQVAAEVTALKTWLSFLPADDPRRFLMRKHLIEYENSNGFDAETVERLRHAKTSGY